MAADEDDAFLLPCLPGEGTALKSHAAMVFIHVYFFYHLQLNQTVLSSMNGFKINYKSRLQQQLL